MVYIFHFFTFIHEFLNVVIHWGKNKYFLFWCCCFYITQEKKKVPQCKIPIRIINFPVVYTQWK